LNLPQQKQTRFQLARLFPLGARCLAWAAAQPTKLYAGVTSKQSSWAPARLSTWRTVWRGLRRFLLPPCACTGPAAVSKPFNEKPRRGQHRGGSLGKAVATPALYANRAVRFNARVFQHEGRSLWIQLSTIHSPANSRPAPAIVLQPHPGSWHSHPPAPNCSTSLGISIACPTGYWPTDRYLTLNGWRTSPTKPAAERSWRHERA